MKQQGRSLSLAAAVVVLCVSLFVSHTGLVRLLPDAGNLVLALTALLGALAILQWTAMGRARACRAAGDKSRANMVVTQALLLGLVETTLNWNGIVQLAAEGHADWTTLPASLLVAVFAIGGAWLNVTVKFTSCELLAPPVSNVTVTVEADEPPPAARYDADMSCDDIGVINLHDRLKRMGRFETSDQLAMETVEKSAAARLERAAGRIRTRNYRAARRAVAA